MSGLPISLLCPFCGEHLTISRGEFPFVCSQLLVKFERCHGLPAGTSGEEIAAAAEEITDELLLGESPRCVLSALAQLATVGRPSQSGGDAALARS